MKMRVLGTSISNRDECNKSKLSSFVSSFLYFMRLSSVSIVPLDAVLSSL
jgi:hypothetical protein